jgi:hypothetical protein
VIRKRVTLAVAGAVIALAFAVGGSTASAATTFGADMTQVTHGGATDNCGVSGDCSYIGRVTTTGATEPVSPITGVLTAVRVKTTGAGLTLNVRVLRDTATANTYLNVGPQIPVVVPVVADPNGQITEATGLRHSIQAGDHLGFGFTMGAAFIASAANPSPPPFAFCSFINGDHPADTGAAYNPAGCTIEPLVAATVELDSDHDGFGDETQDQCPTDATTQGSCPAAATPTPTQMPTAQKKKCKKKHHRSLSASAAKKCKKHRK